MGLGIGIAVAPGCDSCAESACPIVPSALESAAVSTTAASTTAAPPTAAPPTPAPPTAPLPTAAPTVTGVVHLGAWFIGNGADPAILSTGDNLITTRAAIGPDGRAYLQISTQSGITTMDNVFPRLIQADEYLGIQRNLGLTTMGNAFPLLAQVEQYLYIELNANLVTLSSAFPALVELGLQSASGKSLDVNQNAALTTLGTAFASLRRIPGTLYFDTNPLLANFDALSNLECHGGAYNNDPATYCQGCPAWLLAKPRC